MPETKIVGYKKIFGLVLPDWVNESMVKNIGMGLLAVATMLLLLIFVIWPNEEVVKTRESSLNVSKNELQSLKNSKASLDRLKIDLTAEDQSRILAAIPQTYSPDGAIYTLRRISADTGVSIVSYSLPSGDLLSSVAPVVGAPSTDMVGFSVFPIRLTVSAPVESLLKFVAGVESSLPFGIVSDLNVQEVSRLSTVDIDKSVQLGLEIRYYQSVLRTVNINKMQPLSEDDLGLARELRNYNLLTIPQDEGGSNGTASGSGSIFGF